VTRRLGSETLVIATHNAGKLKEIGALLAPYGLNCISAGSLGLPEPAETGKTFVENALLKALRHWVVGPGFIPPTGPSGSGSKAHLGVTGTWRWARSKACWPS
jgi:hypothetical protein